MRTVIIDGSFGEGGGQILRTSLCLSCVLGTPVKIEKIRAKRKNPGLGVQHLGVVRILQKISSAKVKGDFLGSQTLEFWPQTIKTGRFYHKIETAGSVALIFHSLLPLAVKIKEPLEIEIEGGATNTFFAPSLFHFQEVFLKLVRKFGIKAEVIVEKEGFYPAGGAKTIFKIYPSFLDPIEILNTGEPRKINLFSMASDALRNKKVAERQAGSFWQNFPLSLSREEEIKYTNTLSPGSVLGVALETEKTILGRDALGEKGVPAETIGKKVAEGLLEEIRLQSAVDKFTADTLPVYLALSGKEGGFKIGKTTSHLETNIKIIEKFLPGSFSLKDNIVWWHPS